MIYGYIRVSTDHQTVENQRYEVECFCQKQNRLVDVWISETSSGAKVPEKRKLGDLLGRLKKGDILVCSELSRLGRSVLMIMEILSYCLKNDAQVWTVKDGYRLGLDITSKVLAFAFGLSAEIERNLISQRTKEALAYRKSKGIVLGRPKGSRNKSHKLSGTLDDIRLLLSNGHSKAEIARRLGVHRDTLRTYLQSSCDLRKTR